jgi:acetate kinase
MNIFVINSGSSSIKYQFFKMPSEKPLCSGLVERIGLEEGVITHKVFTEGKENEVRQNLEIKDHEKGLLEVVSLLTDSEIGVIKNPDEIDVVGHRVVHGGESFAATTIITEDVKKEIRKLFSLAPLHNPSNYLGIEVAERIFSRAKQVAVFDTAFHQTMPERAYRYAIPNEFYKELGIRAYGFHGTSHKYVAEKASEYLGKPSARIITIHLGNGCSMTAVDAGKSVDTTMGFGPLSGLIMGTRSGDIDPSIIFHLINQEGYAPEQVGNLLNKQSGMKGLTGFSDMRDITAAIAKGDQMASIAYELYAYRIKKYIGAYAAALNGLDAIVFTAGVGENDAKTRALVCENMDYLGINLDQDENQVRAKNIREINTSQSKVKVLVVPTNEELEIARQCMELLG